MNLGSKLYLLFLFLSNRFIIHISIAIQTITSPNIIIVALLPIGTGNTIIPIRTINVTASIINKIISITPFIKGCVIFATSISQDAMFYKRLGVKVRI